MAPHLCAVGVPSRQWGAGPGSWVELKLRMRRAWQAAGQQGAEGDNTCVSGDGKVILRLKWQGKRVMSGPH